MNNTNESRTPRVDIFGVTLPLTAQLARDRINAPYNPREDPLLRNSPPNSTHKTHDTMSNTSRKHKTWFHSKKKSFNVFSFGQNENVIAHSWWVNIFIFDSQTIPVRGLWLPGLFIWIQYLYRVSVVCYCTYCRLRRLWLYLGDGFLGEL